jgi:SAM-dependent methyltransferase
MPDVPAPLPPAVIDLRDAEAYERDRPAGAVRLSPEDLRSRPHLLPPRSCPLILVGRSSEELATRTRELEAAERLVLHTYPGETWRETFQVETGRPTRQRLWEPARVVVEAARMMAAPVRALDLACGSGRNAVYLAMLGMDVTAIDVLPDALERAEEMASRHGVRIRTLQRDLEEPEVLDDLQAELIVVVRYLERSLFPALERTLTPGGILAYETFTEAQRQYGHPRNPRFLLREGELRRAFPRLEILRHESVHEGAYLERLLARRRADEASSP